MYRIIFYEKEDGVSDTWVFLEKLRIASTANKDARIQYNQVLLYIQLLAENGTRLPANITKHITDGIWELRPGKNRIFYFFFQNDTFVLLHTFRKKTQKTPKHEIEKAISERKDYLIRKDHGDENME